MLGPFEYTNIAEIVSRPAALSNYLYRGSAKGPDGLKARLSRHARRGKSVRLKLRARLAALGAQLAGPARWR
jgi:hypothetical protein